MTVSEYAIKAHADTNHMYDKYLPYEFHLRMVVQVAKDYKHLIPELNWTYVEEACWCHDLIDDARQSYSQIQQRTNTMVAEIVRAVSNYTRGRNRKERMPREVYDDIHNTPYATFVKLCDRIANVKYSKMTKSSKFAMYKEEHDYFKKKLSDKEGYEEMWEYLDNIFNS